MADRRPIPASIKPPGTSFSLIAVLTLLLVPFVAAAPTLAPAHAEDGFEALDGARDIAIATAVDKTYALVSSLANDAVQVIDITDPSNPLPVAALFDGQDGFVLADVSDIAITAVDDKTYALVASFGTGSIRILDITDPSNPLPVTALLDGQDGFVLGGPSDIAILTTPDKTYALVANLLSSSIQIVDVTDPSNPLPAASIFDEQDGFDALDGVRSVDLVEISGMIYALGAAWNEDALQIVDVTDPSNPLPAASIFDEQDGFDALALADRIDVATISGSVYALTTSNTDDALQIVDITDPSNPLPAASIFDGQDGIALDGLAGIVAFEAAGKTYAIAAVSGDSAVQILDVSDPSSPLQVAALFDGQDGFEALGGAYGVALTAIGERTYALVAASDDHAVQIIDVTAPDTPLLAANIFDDGRGIVAVDEVAEVDTSVMAQIRFDTASIANRAHVLVTEMILQYQSGGEAAFDDITSNESIPAYGLHLFVLDAETFEVKADGTNPDAVGTVPDAFQRADKSFEQIREDLRRDRAMWLDHMQSNPDTGTDQMMHSWLYLYDGHVFGAGYHILDSEVQAVVDEAIRKYEASGTTAFEEIASGVAADNLYPFVLDAATARPVAYGSVLSSADSLSDTFLFGAAKPYTQIIADLNRDGHTWVSYVHANPDAHIQQHQRTWLQLHDGYIFASGYHLPDSRVQSLVEGAVLLYQSNGEEAFDMVTPKSPAYTDALYPFILNFTTSETVAHGAFPDKLGKIPVTSLHQGDVPWPQVQEELSASGSAWVSYVFTNPDTRTDQLKRAYLQLHDGYIFASGYYLPDARVQSVVDEVVSAYRSLGTASFDVLRSGAESVEDPIYATIVGVDGTILANGASAPSISKAQGLPVERDRSLLLIYGDLIRDGHVWVEDVNLHPITLTEQIRRTWLFLYDNYIFSSGYFHADSEVQSQVDRAVFLYVAHGQDAFDMITPDQALDERATLYPFVLDFVTSKTLAHGAYPHLVEEIPALSLHQGAKTWPQIQKELLANGGTWTSYIFANPGTDTDQDKRTWLYLHDGYVFASGYYVDDARVQALVRNAIHLYDVYPTTAFAQIDAVAGEEETVPFYTFVIDPETPEIKAQGIGPGGAGTDLAAFTNADRTMDQILEALDGTSGTWSEYDAVNPLTGETEPKRSWLSMHDGYIFGVGYYNP